MLRRKARQAILTGTTVSLKSPAKGQAITPPIRYFYQALKGRTTITVHT